MRIWQRVWQWLKTQFTASPRPSRSSPRQPASNLGALDASKFAPIEREEAWKWALRIGRRRSITFGGSDAIPSTGDPRTRLIDRHMVAQGLVAPEELAEIHAVGDEMRRVQPQLFGPNVHARAAVEASREERAERKRQKQAESKARREAHAAAVAERKATDILFLGRGVSRGLADRNIDVEKLRRRDLPVLATPADVANALGISIPRLRWLAFHSEASQVSHYVRFQVPKKSGGVRELAAPHRDLKRCQQWILANILSRVPAHPAAHGFVLGRSTVTNAQPHVRAAIVVNTDLEDFFPSITLFRVLGMFQNLGYSPSAATVLALLCTECPRRTALLNGTKYHVAIGPRALPQGACTSPVISNLIARRLDSRLAGIATKLGWTYTRYADDATFSSKNADDDHIGYLLARIRHISSDEGFRVNEKKTRVLRRNAAQMVAGLVVNDRVNVDRATRRRLRAILHQAQHTGLATQNWIGHPNFDGYIEGLVAYLSMVRPDDRGCLKAQWLSIPR